MKRLLIGLISAALGVGAATHGMAALYHTGATTSVEILAGVSRHGGTTVLALRNAQSRITYLTAGTSRVAVTRNAVPIAISNLRAGDSIVRNAVGTIQDLSEEAVVLRGVVTYAPTNVRDIMTVQVTSLRTVLVDVDSKTRFIDRTQLTSSLSDILDSDTVAVHGILNSTLDEMVQSGTVERLGPKLTRSYTAP